MKLQTSLFAGLLLALTANASAKIDWSTDLEKSKELAAKEDKLMLVDFTGSDWCHWCVVLKKEVFDTEEFATAADKYVMVELDFPQDDALITAEKRAANEKVAQKYGIQGFPTVLLMTADGAPVARTGYQEGGPDAYLDHLEALAKPWKTLQNAEGEARKEALAGFLGNIFVSDIETYYSDELEELKKLDPKDESGFVAEMEMNTALLSFEGNVQGELAAGNFDTVLTMVDDFLAKYDVQGEERQHVMMARVMVYVEQNEKEKAFAQLDEMATFAPDSEMTANIAEIKESVESHLELRKKMEEEAAQDPAEAEEAETAEGTEPSVMEKAAEAEKAEKMEDSKPAEKE